MRKEEEKMPKTISTQERYANNVDLSKKKNGGTDGREVTFSYSYDDPKEKHYITIGFKVMLTEEQIDRMAMSYVNRKTANMAGDYSILDIYCKVCDEIMQIKEAEGFPTDVLFESFVSFPKEIDAIAGV